MAGKFVPFGKKADMKEGKAKEVGMPVAKKKVMKKKAGKK